MIEYLTKHWIEIVGVVISLIYLYFSIVRVIWLWPFGFASAIFYIVIYFQSGFFADMGLQFYYAGISIYGWMVWYREQKRGTKDHTQQGSLKVIRLTMKNAWVLIGVFLILWALLWYILDRFTGSTIPGWDGLTTAGSIIATWMLARKILEHWLVWVVVDAISMGLYIWKELYPTVVLFVFYTALAVVGYIQWKKAVERT